MQDERYARALASLDGLSVGDAFGERFFVSPEKVEGLLARRVLTAGPWPYTDDTQMALSILSILRQYGGIEQDALARSFARRYDSRRGYGPAMHGLLSWIDSGVPWAVLTRRLFHGQGSFGNGAAMRVAPLGAYFADDLDAAVEQARLSAEVTHAHPEGIAGAIAVAVAAALAWQVREADPVPRGRAFIDLVLPHVPDSEVREKIRHARNLTPESSVMLAVSALGNGTGVSAQDTVPFVLWCAAERLDNFEEALWLTVSGLGDRDTTCAMVGGIVAAHVGREGIPEEWLRRREPLPDWPFQEVERPTACSDAASESSQDE
jgi:ADP-ribosylglycohydrolase